MKDLRARLVDILANMAGLPADQLKPETTLESLGLDSLDFVELILVIEDELGTKVGQDAFSELVTVQDAVDALEAAGALSS